MKCQLEKIWILRNVFEIYNVCIIFSYLCRPRFLKESIRGMISYEDLKTIIFLGSSSIISSSWSNLPSWLRKRKKKTLKHRNPPLLLLCAVQIHWRHYKWEPRSCRGVRSCWLQSNSKYSWSQTSSLGANLACLDFIRWIDKTEPRRKEKKTFRPS